MTCGLQETLDVLTDRDAVRLMLKPDHGHNRRDVEVAAAVRGGETHEGRGS